MRYTDFTPYDLVLLAQGLGISLYLFIATTLMGLMIGTALAIIRLYRIPALRQVVGFLTELLKNSPVLVQLFLVFFGVPAFFRLNLTPIEAAMITLTGNTTAFIYVIAVSSMEAVGREQVEAARVFGLTRWQVLRHIIAPQAAAFAIGPLTGLMVNQLQVTSLISVIGVMDLTKVGNILNLRTLKPFIVWSVVGLLYYLVAKLVAWLGARYEAQLRAHSAWRGG
ncbi:amino acid ABC transporter permease [Labrys miyagiensis]